MELGLLTAPPPHRPPKALLQVSLSFLPFLVLESQKEAGKCKGSETFGAGRVQAPHPSVATPSAALSSQPGGLGKETAAQGTEDRTRPPPGPGSLLLTRDAPPRLRSSSLAQGTPGARSSCPGPTSSYSAAGGDL